MMMEAYVKVKRLLEWATLPEYAHDTDSGADIRSCEKIVVPAHGRKTVSTGICAEIEYGYELQVRPKSGLAAKHGIMAAFGTVDCGYRGEILVTLINTSGVDYEVNVGDKIAQLVLAPVVQAEFSEVDEIKTDTDRGTGGFGSTGK